MYEVFQNFWSNWWNNCAIYIWTSTEAMEKHPESSSYHFCSDHRKTNQKDLKSELSIKARGVNVVLEIWMWAIYQPPISHQHLKFDSIATSWQCSSIVRYQIFFSNLCAAWKVTAFSCAPSITCPPSCLLRRLSILVTGCSLTFGRW